MNNIIIREIQEADLEKGFLESLDNLKKASDLEKNNAKTILKKILDDSNHIIHIAEPVSYTHLTLPTSDLV